MRWRCPPEGRNGPDCRHRSDACCRHTGGALFCEVPLNPEPRPPHQARGSIVRSSRAMDGPRRSVEVIHEAGCCSCWLGGNRRGVDCVHSYSGECRVLRLCGRGRNLRWPGSRNHYRLGRCGVASSGLLRTAGRPRLLLHAAARMGSVCRHLRAGATRDGLPLADRTSAGVPRPGRSDVPANSSDARRNARRCTPVTIRRAATPPHAGGSGFRPALEFVPCRVHTAGQSGPTARQRGLRSLARRKHC
jgi:hypothetical protein